MAAQGELRTLLLAPTAKDAQVSRSVLQQGGIAATVCRHFAEVCEEISRGAGAVLLTEESLAEEQIAGLTRILGQQPEWSDLPVIVLASGGADSALAPLAQRMPGSLLVLDRPVSIAVLVSALQTALRARRRQYELRDFLQQRRLAEEELRRAKDAAESANRAKDHFLAVLSHELRTPLTPVMMAVSMLQDRPDLDPEIRATLEIVRRNVEMETRLIDDLLDVTRIARGKVELVRKPVQLCKVIDRAVEFCKPDIEARGLEFGVDMGPAAPYCIEADMSRLQQVLWNLLRNAIKFTPHGGSMGIRCRLEEGSGFTAHGSEEETGVRVQGSEVGENRVPRILNPEPRTLNRYVVVEVIDSGVGIEREALSRIFNAFEQEERSITRQFGGLGLGLAISKALVEMHGGTIEASSEGRNKGATFRIRLPLCRPAHALEATPSSAAPPPPVRPLHILLVEDHGVTAKMMQMVLTAASHRVESTGDLATALELVGQQPFDLLISDLGLPDGSGHDLLRQLRGRGYQFPAIALSGYGQEEDIRRSREAGFAVHLTKPASREALVEAVAAVTRAQRTTSPDAAAPAPPPAMPLFDAQAALEHCLGKPDLLVQLVQVFIADVETLLPKIQTAWQRGDLAEVAKLGHRLKGTIAHLGAAPAQAAATRVEQLGSGSAPAAAEEAVKLLERECQALRAALAASVVK